jgi:hypothetical protein
MPNHAIVALVTAALALEPVDLVAQRGLRFHAAIGPYRVDDLAGTPLVPVIGLAKPVGKRGIVAANLGWIRDAGFYGLDALTLDLDVGIGNRPSRIEWNATVGPSAMIGGDGDGTPYVGAAGHATGGLIWWFDPRIGVTAAATGRLWITSGNSRFSPGAAFGVTFRGSSP